MKILNIIVWSGIIVITLVTSGIVLGISKPFANQHQYDTGYRAGESAAYTAAFATLDNQAAKITQLERLLEECRVKQGHRTAERP